MTSRTPAIPRRRVILAAAAIPPMLTARRAAADEFVRESVYNYIIVSKDGPIVSFRRVENGATLSAIDLRRPERQVIPYTRYLFLPALISPAPPQALSIGLGAGAFNRLFNVAFHASRLTTVEIDPMIVSTANEFTGFKESDRNRVEIADGRRFLRRDATRWDWIVLDAYIRRSQIPPHLTTVEFFTLAKDRLTQDGVLTVNLTGSAELVRRISMTIESVFPGSLFWPVEGGGNVVCVATAKPGLAERIAAAPMPHPDVDLLDYDVDLPSMAHGRRLAISVDKNALLTDDFAPTEYLNRD